MGRQAIPFWYGTLGKCKLAYIPSWFESLKLLVVAGSGLGLMVFEEFILCDGHFSSHNLIDHSELTNHAPLGKIFSTQFLLKLCDTCSPMMVITDITHSSVLYLFYSFYILFSVWIPNSSTVLYMGSNQKLVGCFFEVTRATSYILSHKSRHLEWSI